MNGKKPIALTVFGTCIAVFLISSSGWLYFQFRKSATFRKFDGSSFAPHIRNHSYFDKKLSLAEFHVATNLSFEEAYLSVTFYWVGDRPQFNSICIRNDSCCEINLTLADQIGVKEEFIPLSNSILHGSNMLVRPGDLKQLDNNLTVILKNDRSVVSTRQIVSFRDTFAQELIRLASGKESLPTKEVKAFSNLRSAIDAGVFALEKLPWGAGRNLISWDW